MKDYCKENKNLFFSVEICTTFGNNGVYVMQSINTGMNSTPCTKWYGLLPGGRHFTTYCSTSVIHHGINFIPKSVLYYHFGFNQFLYQLVVIITVSAESYTCAFW